MGQNLSELVKGEMVDEKAHSCIVGRSFKHGTDYLVPVSPISYNATIKIEHGERFNIAGPQ